MWKLVLLCLTLVLSSFTVFAENLKDNTDELSKTPNKDIEDDPGLALGQEHLGIEDQPDEPREFESMTGYNPPPESPQKRGPFGFVGSRGRRVEAPSEAMFGSDFPLRQPEGGSARLRMLLDGRHQALLSKEKRKPHFGFHGSRG